MNKALENLANKLKTRKEQNALRKLPEQRNLIDFVSNDYLGLARNVDLQKIVDQKFSASNKKLGATGSRLLSGNDSYTTELEAYLAKFYYSESALLFNSGYNANTALLQCIPQRGDTIIYDELIHASLKEGARLSFADKYSFKHNDLLDLEKKIKLSKGQIYIVVESIYSMDGDTCDLDSICKIAQKYNASIILDEAHSTGVLGISGKGMAVDRKLNQQIFARVHTFGKGMGCHGGLVVGSQVLKDYLINYALSFIYTTALPIHSLITIRSAHDYLLKNSELVNQLRSKVSLFDESINISYDQINPTSPIKIVKVSGNDNVKSISKSIQDAGFDVRPIMSPTVKIGEERLRICLHTFNTDQEIIMLCEIINKLVQ